MVGGFVHVSIGVGNGGAVGAFAPTISQLWGQCPTIYSRLTSDAYCTKTQGNSQSSDIWLLIKLQEQSNTKLVMVVRLKIDF